MIIYRAPGPYSEFLYDFEDFMLNLIVSLGKE